MNRRLSCLHERKRGENPENPENAGKIALAFVRQL